MGPGFGLPGALWSQIGLYATNGINGIGNSAVSHNVYWREVDELANDPDQVILCSSLCTSIPYVLRICNT